MRTLDDDVAVPVDQIALGLRLFATQLEILPLCCLPYRERAVKEVARVR